MKNECPSTDGDDFTSRTDLDMNTLQQLEQFAHILYDTYSQINPQRDEKESD